MAAPVASAAPAGRGTPNVIVIVADDLGCRDLGCYGAADMQTPSLDAMAASGAIFQNWYSNAPLCAPARASILTGRYPQNAGVAVNGLPLVPGQLTIAEMLKPRGYATACIGKWHLGDTPTTDPNAHGFDYFYGFRAGCVDFYSHRYYWGEPRVINFHDLWRNRTEIFEDGRYLTERITEETVGFIRQQKQRSFFAYVAYNAVHYPMHAPAKYMNRFAGLDEERRTYGAMLAAMDDGIGEIRKTLAETGRLENTLIVFVGDNGATTEKRAGLKQDWATAGRNGVFRGFKFSLFDGGMHVPAVMSWPSVIPAGQNVREVVMSMDILPTVCAAAGAAPPQGYAVDGADILAVAARQAKSPHEAVFWSSGEQLAVRRGKWKLVLNGRTYDRSPEGAKPLPGEDAVFLSDLEADPGETRNLRRENPALVDELTTLLKRGQAPFSPRLP
jgi:arylsulfatase A-like enzyme